MKSLDTFIKTHGFQLIVILCGFIVTFTVLQGKVLAIESQVAENTKEVRQIDVLDARLSDICHRLDRIEVNQDKLIELLTTR